jgi:hypothetical protein
MLCESAAAFESCEASLRRFFSNNPARTLSIKVTSSHGDLQDIVNDEDSSKANRQRKPEPQRVDNDRSRTLDVTGLP